MKARDRKKIQVEYAKNNISYLFNLLEKRFMPKFDKSYLRDINRLSQGFNIRLTREQKLKFCKNCNTFFTTKTREIRFDSKNKTKNIICKNCSTSRRFSYSSSNELKV